jgi:ABC-type sugar transport system ATPase subunit
MAAIRLDRVRKAYTAGHIALRDVDLAIADGEFLVLVGPSGCGKSTLLRVIAGLEAPTAGRVWIGGKDLTAASPQARDLAMVFQSYALYPHMTVRENLGYGLRVRGTPASVVSERVEAVAEALGIAALLDRRPAQLSGGERQRVALGRAMAREPRAFLLDEPLSNLDPARRAHARAELRLLHRRLAATIVYVTHDQEEAMTLGSRVAVMRAGAIEQVAPPLDIYERPANAFVAQFIGAPAMNMIPAALLGIDQPAGAVAGVRPHQVKLRTTGRLRATVELVEPRGQDCLVHLRLDTVRREPVIAVTGAAEQPAADAAVSIEIGAGAIHLFGSDGTRLPGGPVSGSA